MTKKERNNAYKKALEKLPSLVKQGNGMCYALSQSGFSYYPYYSMENCPEFRLFEPEELSGCYWLPHSDLQTRQIILDFCILMTE